MSQIQIHCLPPTEFVSLYLRPKSYYSSAEGMKFKFDPLVYIVSLFLVGRNERNSGFLVQMRIFSKGVFKMEEWEGFLEGNVAKLNVCRFEFWTESSSHEVRVHSPFTIINDYEIS